MKPDPHLRNQIKNLYSLNLKDLEDWKSKDLEDWKYTPHGGPFPRCPRPRASGEAAAPGTHTHGGHVVLVGLPNLLHDLLLGPAAVLDGPLHGDSPLRIIEGEVLQPGGTAGLCHPPTRERPPAGHQPQTQLLEAASLSANSSPSLAFSMSLGQDGGSQVQGEENTRLKPLDLRGVQSQTAFQHR